MLQSIKSKLISKLSSTFDLLFWNFDKSYRPCWRYPRSSSLEYPGSLLSRVYLSWSCWASPGSLRYRTLFWAAYQLPWDLGISEGAGQSQAFPVLSPGLLSLPFLWEIFGWKQSLFDQALFMLQSEDIRNQWWSYKPSPENSSERRWASPRTLPASLLHSRPLWVARRRFSPRKPATALPRVF